jgi:hypothetical protein
MRTTPSLPVRAGQALMEASRLLARPQEVRIESRYRRHRGVGSAREDAAIGETLTRCPESCSISSWAGSKACQF